MIAKEAVFPPTQDPLELAGQRAEEQMAYYLRRAFVSDASVVVLNDVRLVLPPELAAAEGDAVQIDHLVIHRHGMVIIESKSVTSRVTIDDYGHWTRLWNGSEHGMPSPIQQAKRQAEALRAILQANASTLRDRKILGLMQGTFRACPLDLIVAISDQGVVRSKGKKPTGVMKADMVTDEIRRLKDEHAKRDDRYTLTDAETPRIVSFLVSKHQPRPSTQPAPVPTSSSPAQVATPVVVAKSPPPVAVVSKPNSTHDRPAAPSAQCQGPKLETLSCSSCSSSRVQIVHAKYGYCLKCQTCNAFSKLSFDCLACGKRARVRKAGPEFFRDCEACGASALFFRNES